MSDNNNHYTLRIKALTKVLQEYGITDFLVTDLDNIFYLTGFRGTHAMLWQNQKGRSIFITDRRYEGQAKALCQDQNLELLIYKPADIKTFVKAFPPILHIEDTLTLQDLKSWEQRAPEVVFKIESGIVEALRIIKDAKEIKLIRQAQAHADQILETVLPPLIQSNITEKALAFKLEQALMEEGVYGLSFPSIVAFGENSAIPHHQNSNRKIKPGDNILVDCGVVLQGYCSDITRNFSLGSPTREYQHKYDHLLKTQEATIQQIKSGMAINALADFCRKTLKADEPFFTHSLGHNVGINVHEKPVISYRIKAPLKANTIITIEPGLYYEGRFGIRIEDLVWVKTEGYEVLSQCPKELIIIQ